MGGRSGSESLEVSPNLYNRTGPDFAVWCIALVAATEKQHLKTKKGFIEKKIYFYPINKKVRIKNYIISKTKSEERAMLFAGFKSELDCIVATRL